MGTEREPKYCHRRGDGARPGWAGAQKCHLIVTQVFHTASHPHHTGCALGHLCQMTS